MAQKQIDSIINSVIQLRNNDELFFNEIIEIAYDQDLESQLHNLSMKTIENLLISFGQSFIDLSRIPKNILHKYETHVLLSLSVIAYKHYDDRLWEYIKEEYETLYEKYNQSPKIDTLIRQLIGNWDLNQTIMIAPPIMHALVPVHFQNHFFDFVYTIFEYNFDKALYTESNIYRVLKYTFTALKNKLNRNRNLTFAITSDGHKLKTYGFSKFTLDAISKFDESFIEVIKDFLVLFDHIVNDSDFSLCSPIVAKHYLETVQNWMSENSLSSQPQKDRKPYKNSYKLDSKNILWLNVKNLFFENISASDINSIKVLITENNENRIMSPGTDYRVLDAVGALKFDFTPIKIINPFSKRKLAIYLGSELIYQTQEKINKPIYIFDENNNEIEINRKTEGTVTVIFPKEHTFEHQPFFENEFYKISQFIPEDRTYHIGAISFSFFGKLENIIEAVYANNCVIQKGNNEYNPITQLLDIIIHANKEKHPKSIAVNDRVISYGDSAQDVEELLFCDFNVIKILDQNDELICDFNHVFFDPTLDIIFNYYDESKFSISINSQLNWYYEGKLATEKELFFDYQTNHSVVFSHESIQSIKLKVLVDRGLISFDNKPWQLIDEIHQYRDNFSSIRISYQNCKYIKITGLTNKNQREILLEENKREHTFSSSQLYDLSNDEDSYLIQFYDQDNILKSKLYFHTKPSINSLNILYSDKYINVQLNTSCFEKNTMEYKVIYNGATILKDKIDTPEFAIEKKTLKPFTKYIIVFYRVEDIFKWKGKKLIEDKIYFYSIDELEGMIFPIDTVCLDNVNNKGYDYKKLNNTSLLFVKLNSFDNEKAEYRCTLFRKNTGKKFDYLNPMFVTIYREYPEYPNLVDDDGDAPFYDDFQGKNELFDGNTNLKNNFGLYCICLDYSKGRK